MRRLRIDDPFVDGAVLARDLRAPGGEVLARAGMALGARSTRALREHGVDLCFVEDDASAGLVTPPLVDTAGADAPVLRALRDAAALVWRFVEAPSRQSTTRAIEDLRGMRIIGALDSAGAIEALRAAAGGFVERVVTRDGSTGFLTDRQSTDDLFGHSLAVAALTVRLGADVGFQQRDLQTAALAALMHDIGLLMVPEAVRRTPPAQRTGGQQRRYEDHTVLGEAILQPLERREPALPVVAVEHHEEQGGGGFPHGLIGGNRVLRAARPAGTAGGAGVRTAARGTPPPTPQVRRISLISEIVAVADRYEGLISPAPGHQPLSPAAARRVLSSEAGSRLNAEVVGRFLDVLPQWPLGTDVVLKGGAHEGARAVVVGADAGQAERPRVRVYADRHGRRVPPTEVTLAAQPDVGLTPSEDAAA